MTPTHRLNLADVERVPVDAAMCRSLVAQARRHRELAVAARAIPDLVGGFQVAYDGCRKVALSVVLASGLRPKSAAHHKVTFDAAAALVARHRNGAEASAIKKSLDDATDLRQIRAGSEYRAEEVTAANLEDAVAILDELLDALPALLDQLLA